MIDKKTDAMDDIEKQKAEIIIQRTIDRLSIRYANVSEQSIKALFLINGGGVVALLAYFHDVKVVNNFLLFSFSCFLLGILLAVIVVGVDNFVSLSFLNNYDGNIEKFNKNEISLKEAQIFGTPFLLKLIYFFMYVGYFSGFLFIAGCILGVIGYVHISL